MPIYLTTYHYPSMYVSSNQQNAKDQQSISSNTYFEFMTKITFDMPSIHNIGKFPIEQSISSN